MTGPRTKPSAGVEAPLRHAALPLLIFLVVTLVAVGAAWALWQSSEARDRSRFDVESRIAALAVTERIERQTALLRGAAGLFAADPDLSASSFDAYAERLGSTRSYPGVLGLGYAPFLRGPAERDAFVARMRLTAASDYGVRPDGARSRGRRAPAGPPRSPRGRGPRTRRTGRPASGSATAR